MHSSVNISGRCNTSPDIPHHRSWSSPLDTVEMLAFQYISLTAFTVIGSVDELGKVPGWGLHRISFLHRDAVQQRIEDLEMFQPSETTISPAWNIRVDSDDRAMFALDRGTRGRSCPLFQHWLHWQLAITRTASGSCVLFCWSYHSYPISSQASVLI